jgi:hypothetical protein
VLRLAHRGARSRAPENTLAAFAAALARPDCDGLDLAALTVTRRRTLARLARLGVVAACVEGAALREPGASLGRATGRRS